MQRKGQRKLGVVGLERRPFHDAAQAAPIAGLRRLTVSGDVTSTFGKSMQTLLAIDFTPKEARRRGKYSSGKQFWTGEEVQDSRTEGYI